MKSLGSFAFLRQGGEVKKVVWIWYCNFTKKLLFELMKWIWEPQSLDHSIKMAIHLSVSVFGRFWFDPCKFIKKLCSWNDNDTHRMSVSLASTCSARYSSANKVGCDYIHLKLAVDCRLPKVVHLKLLTVISCLSRLWWCSCGWWGTWNWDVLSHGSWCQSGIINLP